MIINQEQFTLLADKFRGEVEVVKKLLILHGYILLDKKNIVVTKSGEKLIKMME